MGDGVDADSGRAGSKVLGGDSPTNTHVFLCLIWIALSFDWLNPVKLFCDETGVPNYAFGLTALAVLVYTVISDFSNVVYFSMRIFFRVILSTVFSNIEIVGLDNVPRKGPIIFTGNHANQFVDALQISFLIAQKSWDRPIIGDFAKLCSGIPVARAQDSAKKGQGTIVTAESSSTKTEVKGEGTDFPAQLRPGDKVRFAGSATAYKVSSIAGPSALTIATPADSPCPVLDGVTFDVLPRVDQSVMFRSVFDALKDGRCIGIFPEGGSHDRTDLLPLQAGVALMAFGCLEEHNISVPVVPIGLTYFARSQFRSRVVIEFGSPVTISEELVKQYEKDKRGACNRFLGHVEDGLRAALVTTDSYDTLTLVHTARRLYQRDYEALDTAAKQDLNRRFAEGYKKLLSQGGGNLPEDIANLRAKLAEYRDTLAALGLRDHQVPTLRIEPAKVVLSAVHILILLVISAIPNLLLNLPVGIASTRYAAKAQIKALAGSKVKIEAEDVVLSEAIKLAIIALPALWLTYAFLLLLFSGLAAKTVFFILLSFPLMSYIGVISAEAGMIAIKDLQPLFNQLLFREQLQLRTMRTELQTLVRESVKNHGPSLGELYYDKELHWDEYLNKAHDETPEPSPRNPDPPSSAAA